MKKIIFKLAIIAMFIGLTSMTIEQLSACEVLAVNVHNDMQEAGMSHAESYYWSGIVQDWCEMDLM